MDFSFDVKWQERRDLNPQLTVLETVALPIELLSCGFSTIVLFKTVKPRALLGPSAETGIDLA